MLLNWALAVPVCHSSRSLSQMHGPSPFLALNSLLGSHLLHRSHPFYGRARFSTLVIYLLGIYCIIYIFAGFSVLWIRRRRRRPWGRASRRRCASATACAPRSSAQTSPCWRTTMPSPHRTAGRTCSIENPSFWG